MNVIETYIDKCRSIADVAQAQQSTIATAAKLFAKSNFKGKDGAFIRLRTQPDYGGRNVATVWLFPGI